MAGELKSDVIGPEEKRLRRRLLEQWAIDQLQDMPRHQQVGQRIDDLDLSGE